MRQLIVLVVVLLLTLGVTTSQAQNTKVYDGRPNNTGGVAGIPEGVGTVTYDPGAPADVIVALPGSVNLYGNLFDTRNGAPLSPGTLTRVSWYTGSIGGFAPVWFASPGASATYLGCCSATAPSAFNSAPISVSAPGPFFLGLDVGGTGSFGSLGLRSASTNGQGFHGRQRPSYAGASNTLPGQNAMVRASGSIIVPVELMEFDIE